MKNIKMEIIIKQNSVDAEVNATSIVGIEFFDAAQGAYVGDYESFDGAELTNEQISGAVQRLLMLLLPMVPDVEEPVAVPTGGEKRTIKRNEDGTFSLA